MALPLPLRNRLAELILDALHDPDARKALEDAMNQLKSNGIGTVGPSLVVTKDDLEFIKLEQKQQER